MRFEYDQILNFCVNTIAESPDKSEDRIQDVIHQFRDFDGWDAERLLTDIRNRFSVMIGVGGVLQEDNHAPWLESRKPNIDSFYWSRYYSYLRQQGFDPLPLAEMDHVTDRILGLLNDPERHGPWDRRGMVLGHVQSGKTANYIGLINKAADAGYKVIIVIAGIHNNLRNQTQRRIDEGFRGVASADIKKSAGVKFVGVGNLAPARQPSSFTTTLRDFNKRSAEQVGMPIANLSEPAIFVVKKNSSTLRALVDWLRQYSGVGVSNKIDEPLLLIDDEADNASINTKKNPGEVTRINGLIRELLETFTRSGYVGYTATPFANIFVDPQTDDEMYGRDLFPRDFLVSLEAPSNYFGPAKIFDGSDPSMVLRDADDIEEYIPTVHAATFQPEILPESLLEAVQTFVLTRAIRIRRGQGNKHSSMLVNVSKYVIPQKTVTGLVHDYLSQIRNQIQLYGNKSADQGAKYPFIASLQQVFAREFAEIDEKWPEIYPLLWDAIAPLQVMTINGKSTDVLNYEQYSDTGLHVIAVGGDSLSRGLTLEGLSTSYLSRNSKQYDTLLQMGRWFGYRPGYEDLCRLWLPSIVRRWYEHIAEAAEELRGDVIKMQQMGATPRDFGLRVRSHPDTLLVTARNKMGSSQIVTTSMSLTKTLLETARLSANPDVRARNLVAARNFSEYLTQDPSLERIDDNSSVIFRHVNARYILEFLQSWGNLPASYRTEPDQLVAFISARPQLMNNWVVAFPGSRDATRFTDDRHSTLRIGMQRRTVGNENIRSEIQVGSRHRIMSPTDELIGLSESEVRRARALAEQRGIQPGKNIPGPDIRAVRSTPLLLIHFLDLRTKGGISIFDDPVVGWSISMPDSIDRGELVEYRVNSTYFQEFLADYGDDEEAEAEAF